MTYLLDANVFIEAHRRYYGFDLVPQFWEWLLDAHDRGVVMTIQKVADEIGSGDALHDWFTNDVPDSFIEPLSENVYTQVRIISAWADGCGFNRSALNKFMASADLWLIAQARAHGHIVVSHEKLFDFNNSAQRQDSQRLRRVRRRLHRHVRSLATRHTIALTRLSRDLASPRGEELLWVPETADWCWPHPKPQWRNLISPLICGAISIYGDPYETRRSKLGLDGRIVVEALDGVRAG